MFEDFRFVCGGQSSKKLGHQSSKKVYDILIKILVPKSQNPLICCHAG
jgi:hypothetical protein